MKINLLYKFLLTAFIGGILCSCNTEPRQGNKNDSAIVPAGKIDLTNPLSQMDKSPMDMQYFPVDYSKLKMLGKSEPLPYARVIFSRPQKNGRKIFGNVVKYGEPWRLGANEATEIEFFRDAIIQNQKIPQGRYIIYCIPQQDKWTIILNKDLFTWGLKIDRTKDVYKFDIPVTRLNAPIEVFSMEFENAKDGANLLMGWDAVKTILSISF